MVRRELCRSERRRRRGGGEGGLGLMRERREGSGRASRGSRRGRSTLCEGRACERSAGRVDGERQSRARVFTRRLRGVGRRCGKRRVLVLEQSLVDVCAEVYLVRLRRFATHQRAGGSDRATGRGRRLCLSGFYRDRPVSVRFLPTRNASSAHGAVARLTRWGPLRLCLVKRSRFFLQRQSRASFGGQSESELRFSIPDPFPLALFCDRRLLCASVTVLPSAP